MMGSPGGSSPQRARQYKGSPASERSPNLNAASNVPETLIIARESELESFKKIDVPSHDTKGSVESSGHILGVESLPSYTSDRVVYFKEDQASDPSDYLNKQVSQPEGYTVSDNGIFPPNDISPPPSPPKPRHASPSISQPLTPLYIPSPLPGSSVPGSAKSFSTRSLRQSRSELGSMVDDTGSQAISSGEDDEQEEEGPSSSMLDSHPQLIMPSISMPKRRPFTDTGKGMGRLKIMLAGPKNAGKTSLVRSILQICEHIVHVDPVSMQRQAHKSSRRDSSLSKDRLQLNEIHASTKPYPSWWTNLADTPSSSIRRSSQGEAVLERNICFVDPYLAPKSKPVSDDCTEIEVYLKQCMQRSVDVSAMGQGDLFELLNGNGGPMVDLVLYLVDGELNSQNVQDIIRLGTLTNVVPLISKSDRHTDEELVNLRERNLRTLKESEADIFLLQENDTVSEIYAVSSVATDDLDTMDASLLMSPDYIQPLKPSDLSQLVDRIFKGDSIIHLRHLAVQKLMRWWESLSPDGKTRKGSSTSQTKPTDFSMALAKVDDHQKREDRFAQVRLAKWAKELQRSLANEKRRYEALARGERAMWLSEKLSECVADGTLLAIPSCDGEGSSSESALIVANAASSDSTGKASAQIPLHWRGSRGLSNPQDPLGLIGCSDDMKRLSWVLCRIVGSFGIVGGIAVLIARARGISMESTAKWAAEWNMTFWDALE